MISFLQQHTPECIIPYLNDSGAKNKGFTDEEKAASIKLGERFSTSVKSVQESVRRPVKTWPKKETARLFLFFLFFFFFLQT